MNLISQSKKNIARIFLYLISTLTLNTTIFKKKIYKLNFIVKCFYLPSTFFLSNIYRQPITNNKTTKPPLHITPSPLSCCTRLRKHLYFSFDRIVLSAQFGVVENLLLLVTLEFCQSSDITFSPDYSARCLNRVKHTLFITLVLTRVPPFITFCYKPSDGCP